MTLNSQTYTQYSPHDCIEVLWAGRDPVSRRRVELARDVALGHDEDCWRKSFYALSGVSQWGADVFQCLHLLRPEIDNETFHTAFSHAIAEACFRATPSRYLMFVCALKSWGDLSAQYLKNPEPKARIVERVLDRMANHPRFRTIKLDLLLAPKAHEFRSLRDHRFSMDPAPLMQHFIDNPVQFDTLFKNLSGKRLTWALNNLPAKAVDGYFDRHPESDKLAARLEIQLGL